MTAKDKYAEKCKEAVLSRDWQGLWGGNTEELQDGAYFISETIKKKDLLKLLGDGERKRLVVRINKDYTDGGKRPLLQFIFLDAKHVSRFGSIPYLTISEEKQTSRVLLATDAADIVEDAIDAHEYGYSSRDCIHEARAKIDDAVSKLES